MKAQNSTGRPAGERSGLIWDLLTFDRMLTGQSVHLIYWCGLGAIALAGFGVVGAAVGVAIRSGAWEGMLLALPLLVGGFLMVGVLALLWRAACEFYIAVLRIAEDLRMLRGVAEREIRNGRANPPQA